jgi:MSHA biogenesis protein MshG
MASYRYTGRDSSGRGTSGTVTAETELDVAKVVEAAGFYVTSIMPADLSSSAAGGRRSLFARGISRRDLIVLLHQIETLYRAGVPIATGLELLEQQTESAVLRGALRTITHDVREGRKLSEAFQRHPDLFPQIVTANLVAGEETGALDEVLGRLGDHLEHEDELERFVTGSLRYPAIVAAALVGVISLMILFVFPKLAPLFRLFGDNLPFPTKVLKAVGDGSASVGPMVIGALGVLFVAFQSWKRSAKGRQQWERFLLTLPKLGPILKKLLIARFARSFAVVFRTGVPLLRALDIVAGTLDHRTLAKELMLAKYKMQAGNGIADAMKVVGTFPPLANHLIAIGEQTGRVDEMCTFLADHYEKEARYDLKTMLMLIEPALTGVLAFVVGFTALGVFMPMWNLIDVIKRN